MTHRLAVAAALLFAAATLGAAPARAVSEKDLLPVDQAYQLQVKAVSRERVEFTWTIAPGYYLYKHRFAVQPVDAAFKANALQLPAGHKHHDEFFGDVETYRETVTAVQTGTTTDGVERVQFKVKYQGCADIGVCYPPQTRVLTVDMTGAVVGAGTTATNSNSIAARSAPTTGDALSALTGVTKPVFGNGEALPEDQAFHVEAIANSPAELLVRLTPAPGYYLYRDKTHVRLISGEGVTLGTPHWPAGKPHRDEHFGDVVVYFDQVEIPVPLTRSNTDAQTLSLQIDFQGCLTDGICYPPMTRTLSVSLPAGTGNATVGADLAATGDAGSLAFLTALALAFFGGLILNLMPCVLPVLSFKALGLAQGGESHAHAKKHALWYTLGVLVSFAAIGGAVLALRSAGQALGWGFQLQQPSVVAVLTLLLFAIGLSLSGLWQFGAGLAGTGQSLTEKSGATGDFFTGVLAVVVASPCTAPFMGSALGYAFTAPVLPAMLVFLALGLGLALPFLLIGFVPALASRLPRPGAWMDTLKQWLAYPMYLTAVWLAWVFGKQRGMDALALLLIAAVVLALSLWWIERQRYAEGIGRKLLGWVLLAIALATMVVALRAPGESRTTAATQGSEPYSAARLAALRAQGKPVFVDMTADWCITCKVNEKAVLHTDAFAQLLAETGTVYLVGDWTNQDAEISAFLDQYHAPGVPLYVVFPADGGEGRKLPQLLSDKIMRDALTDAANR